MRILHPYTGLRPEDERETWTFLAGIRNRYYVYDQRMGVENGFPRTAYVDFIAVHWGTDDLIILEDDKVPTLQDFDELVACKEKFCCFPYRSFGDSYDPAYWKDIKPHTLGFVKFSKGAQLALPISEWGRDIDKPKIYPFAPADMMIEGPLTAKLGNFHLHEPEIKHNHARAP